MRKEKILEKISTIDGRSIYFEKYRNDELIKTVRIVTLTKEKDGFKYIILLDSYGKTIFEVYKYLNHDIADSDWKRREKAMQALKFFFSFVELYNIKNYRDFKKSDLSKFTAFLRGGDVKGNTLELQCSTTRQSITLNQYMAVYRDFFEHLQVENSIFHNKKLVGATLVTSATSSGYSKANEKYDSNDSIANVKRISMYIRVEEYLRILDLIKSDDSKYGLREEIIIRLMFEHGLRLSEVLGLTMEDVFENCDVDNDEFSKIILRNRASDKQYQRCKNLTAPRSEKEYKHQSYNTEKIGKHTVIINKEIYKLIQEYINDTRDVFNMSKIAIKNIKRAKADAVNPKDRRENYYIFLNKNYTPLGHGGWNKILRDIYESVGIPIDTETKENNLSHRFRHGFAMICVKNNVDRFALKELLRHKKVATVDIYYNPTVEDNIEAAIDVHETVKKALAMNLDFIRFGA